MLHLYVSKIWCSLLKLTWLNTLQYVERFVNVEFNVNGRCEKIDYDESMTWRKGRAPKGSVVASENGGE